MTDSLFQQVGNVRLPSKASDVDSSKTLCPLDPARDTLLALLAAAINFELGPAWDQVAATVPALTGKHPVQDTWGGPPTPEMMLQRKGDFPILFLSRDGDAQHEYHSLVRPQTRQTWELHYVLGPYHLGEERKVRDALTYIDTVVLATIERGGHPAYQSGAKVLYSAGFATLSLGRSRRGKAKFADAENAPTYWMLSSELESTEIMVPTPGTSADWKSTGYSFGTGNADGIIDPFLQADSEQYRPPAAPWAPDRTDGATLTTGGDTLVTPGGDVLVNA